MKARVVRWEDQAEGPPLPLPSSLHPLLFLFCFFCFFCFFTETSPIFMAKTDLFAVKVYPENVSKNTMATGEDVLTLA